MHTRIKIRKRGIALFDAFENVYKKLKLLKTKHAKKRGEHKDTVYGIYTAKMCFSPQKNGEILLGIYHALALTPIIKQ